MKADTNSIYTEERISCPYIEGGLTFQNHGITTCCAIHNGHNWPLLHLYQDDLTQLPVDEILENRRKIQKEVQDGTNPICKGCKSLLKREWEPSDYPFRLISVQNDLRCNIRCEYCNFLVKWDDYKKNYRTYKMYPLIKEMVDKKLLAPDAQFFWAGGEPSILDEFPKCLETIFAYSDKIRLQIATNATVLPPELQEVCRKYGKQINVLCSLDCGTKETYYAVKQKDYFDEVVKNLSIYTGLVDKVLLKMIITKTNLHDIDAFLEIANKLHLKQVFYDIDCTQDMEKVPEEMIEAMVRLSLKALTFGIVAVPASVWQFQGKISDRILSCKSKIVNGQSTPPPPPYTGKNANSSICIKVNGKDDRAFSDEVFIINISSNRSPTEMIWNDLTPAEVGTLYDSSEAPTGKKILLSSAGKGLELACEAEVLYIWVQCSKWGGIMSVEENGVKTDFNLYSPAAENRIIVYRRQR